MILREDIDAVRFEFSRQELGPGVDQALFSFAAGCVDALREGDAEGFGDLADAVRGAYAGGRIHVDAPLGDVAAALILLWSSTYDLTDQPLGDLQVARRICSTVYRTAEDPMTRARAVTTLSDVAQRAFDRCGDFDLIRESVDLLRDGLEYLVVDVPEVRPFLLIGLANAFDTLAESTGLGDQLDEAIRDAELAEGLVTDADVRIALDGSLASLLLRRFRFLRSPEDLQKALRRSRSAVELTHRSHAEWANRANRLAGALIEAYHLSEDEQNLREADVLLQDAARRLASGSPLHAAVTVNRAAVGRLRGQNHAGAYGTDWIADLRFAAEALDANSVSLVECNIALGDALAARYQQTGSVADLEESLSFATVAARTAAAVSVDRQVTSLESAGARARLLADLKPRSQRSALLQRSAASYLDMLDKVLEVLANTPYIHGERWLRDVFGAGTMAAEALAQDGRQREARDALLRGRALRRRLSEQSTDLSEHSAPVPVSTPVFHIAAAVTTGLAIADDGEGIETLWLPELSVEELTRQANLFYAAVAQCHNDAREGFDGMRAVLSWLWEAAMQPIATWLERQGASQVCLAPYGLLQLLPLHAACRPGPSGSESWRYFCDDVMPVYFASGSNASARMPLDGRGALIVGEPATSLQLAPLAGANHEADIVSRLTKGHLLPADKVTAERLQTTLRNASYFHFAGHGEATSPVRPDEPVNERKGCLILAGEDRLWDVDVRRLQMSSMSLVTLSACETGRVDATMPDEGLSLANSFLDAGAQAVISTLWAVPDGTTADLMIRFAEYWVVRGLEAGDALQKAQADVRTTRD